MRVSRLYPGLLLLGALLPSCEKDDGPEGPQEREFTLKREWDRDNAPTQIGLTHRDYSPHFYTLPKTGRLKKSPWSSHYLPNWQGGGSYRWSWENAPSEDHRIRYPIMSKAEVFSSPSLSHLSPVEKYDVYIGDYSFSNTRQERTETEVMRYPNQPRWPGKCHAWATASYEFDSPGSFVTKSKDGLPLPFGAADVQSLLTVYIHRNPTYSFLVSRRCNVDEGELRGKLNSGQITREQFYEILDSAECQGVNPGSLHILLTNMIGLRDMPFVADVDRFAAVWNQPVYGFNTTVLETRTSNFKAPYAPGTKKTLLVETQMIYTKEIGYYWERVPTPSSFSEGVRNYKYWLELDGNDNIIGGLWESEDRPDFLWRQETPIFTPEWKPLEKLYLASIADLKPGDRHNRAHDARTPSRTTDPAETPERGQPDTTRAYYDEPVTWNIERGTLFYYVRHVGIKVRPEVKRVVLEVIRAGGSLVRYFDLVPSPTNRNYFQTFDHSIAKAHMLGAGKIRLRGLDGEGRELFSLNSYPSQWNGEE